MPGERESPSGGWREVYREMDAGAGTEEATHSCPNCDRTCENVLRDVYQCEEHGVFRASADTPEDASESEDVSESGDGSNAGESAGTDEGEDRPTRPKGSAD